MWTNEDEERLAELAYKFVKQHDDDVVDELFQLYDQKVNDLQCTIDYYKSREM